MKNSLKLEQLERLRSEDTPRRLMIITRDSEVIVMELRIYTGNHISDAAPCTCVCVD